MEVKVDSNRIRSERENRGWSQGHLAGVAGLSLRTIQRIEKTGSASFESVTSLAAVLSIEVADLRAKETEPSRGRVIRLSLEWPVRLAFAVVSGVLCALLPLRVTAAFWFLGLAASLVGGAAMYAGFEVFGDTTSSAIFGYCTWHILACIAIHGGHEPHDAQSGLLAALMRARGRFSIVPGWMKLGHSTIS